ncbi:hypothetical protein DdX_21337 [Ditylenchus destructor]|uniref:Secreted protein n=1 Tax=Ditylenchus destructor TaxID=166010 RepID=A0AAD4MFP4_9BILA|nr:hypothetical protein DdX_21337 [Ditylenchus destructor]
MRKFVVIGLIICALITVVLSATIHHDNPKHRALKTTSVDDEEQREENQIADAEDSSSPELPWTPGF